MAYIGNIPAEKFTSVDIQNFTVSATANYTLDRPVANENEIELFINNVRQHPGSGKAYTASGTALTLSEATAGTDTMYCVYQGKARQTVTPATSSVTNAMLAGSIDLTSKVTGALPQANIADQAINEAKLQISNAPTNGYMLTAQSGNTGGLTWAEAPSGDLVRINGSAISSTVSSVDFQGAFTSTYKTYLITISGVVMSSAADTRLKFMVGSSVISDTYKMVFHGYRNAGDSNEGQQSSTSGLILHNSASKADQPVNGFIYVYNPLNTSYHKHVNFLFSYKDSNDYYLTQNGSGIWENTAAADGFQILRGNGSLYSAGEIQVYGLTNA